MGAASFIFSAFSNPWKEFSVAVAKIMPVKAIKAYWKLDL
jgi:hypothetical protein